MELKLKTAVNWVISSQAKDITGTNGSILCTPSLIRHHGVQLFRLFHLKIMSVHITGVSSSPGHSLMLLLLGRESVAPRHVASLFYQRHCVSYLHIKGRDL